MAINLFDTCKKEKDTYYVSFLKKGDLTKCRVEKMFSKIDGNARCAYVKIGEDVSSIKEESFVDCSVDVIVQIPRKLTNIHSRAFDLCKSILAFEVESGNTAFKSVDGNLYSKNGKELLKYAPAKKEGCFHVPAEVERLGGWSIRNSPNLTNVELPAGLTHIGWSALSLCDRLEEVFVPDGVTEIESWAFSGSSSLKVVSIPKSVVKAGYHMFQRCPADLVVYCEAISRPKDWSLSFNKNLNDGKESCVVIFGKKGEQRARRGKQLNN